MSKTDSIEPSIYKIISIDEQQRLAWHAMYCMCNWDNHPSCSYCGSVCDDTILSRKIDGVYGEDEPFWGFDGVLPYYCEKCQMIIGVGCPIGSGGCCDMTYAPLLIKRCMINGCEYEGAPVFYSKADYDRIISTMKIEWICNCKGKDCYREKRGKKELVAGVLED